MRPGFIKHVGLIRPVFVIVLGLLAAIRSFAQSDKAFVPAPDSTKLAKASEMERDAQERKDSLALAEAYYIFGKAYSNAGLRNKGEAYFLKSLRILEPRGDSFELGKLYIWLADSEGRSKRNDQMWARAYQAKSVFERIGSKEGLLKIHGMLGRFHIKAGDFAASIENLKKAQDLAVELNDSLGIAEASLFLGQTFATRDKEEALVYLKEAVEMFERLDHPASLVYAYAEVAKVYLSMGKYAETAANLAEAEKMYASLGSSKIHIYRGLQTVFRDYYLKTGDWEAANKHFRLLMKAEFEIGGIRQDSVVRRLHAEFETEKKEALLAAQQNEIRFQQNRNYLLLAVLCLSVFFTGILYRLYLRNRRLSLQNAHLVREQGHRIRNHLQMISNMLQLNSVVLSDPDAKATLVESELRVQSIALLQKGLYSRNDGAEVFLPEYFALLTDHVLEVSGYEWVEKHLKIEAIFLHPDRALPVALILNELVTNSCKYAFPGHPAPQLKVRCRQEGERIHFMVTDNGPGFSPLFPGAEQSFGMQLIRVQAEQLYAVYSFQNDPETGGALFEMEFSA